MALGEKVLSGGVLKFNGQVIPLEGCMIEPITPTNGSPNIAAHEFVASHGPLSLSWTGWVTIIPESRWRRVWRKIKNAITRTKRHHFTE